MRKTKTQSASQPSPQHSIHTHEVTFPAAGCLVTIRCYSASGANRERAWQAQNGRQAEVKRVGQ